MRSWLRSRNALMLPWLLPMLFWLASCQTLGVTPTTATIVAETCRAWKELPPVGFSGREDSKQTVAEVQLGNQRIEAQNAARKAWGCP